MKIIYCLNSFFPKHSGGTEVYTLSLMREMKKLGHETIVVIPNHNAEELIEFNIYDVRVIAYPENTKFKKDIAWGSAIPEGIKHFKEILLKEKPEIVHFQEFSYSIGITPHHFRLTKEMGIKVVMTMHIAGYSCFNGDLMYLGKKHCDGKIREYKCTKCVMHSKGLSGIKLKSLSTFSSVLYHFKINLSKWNNKIGTALGFPFLIHHTKNNLDYISQNCDQIVVVADWYKKVLIKNGIRNEKITLVKQGLALRTNSIAQIKYNTDFSPLKIIFLGRVTKIKGLDLLIDCVLEIPETQISLDIFGHAEGTDFEMECKQKSKYNKNITWNDKIPPDDVLSKLSHYNLLCLPSVCSEMASLVIQEAFASKIPVLASNTPGNAEFIKEGENGWLFKLADKSDLKAKLNTLIQNPDLLKIASNKIPEIKHFDTVAIEYQTIYNKTIQTT